MFRRVLRLIQTLQHRACPLVDLETAVEILSCVVDKPLLAAAYVPEGDCLLLSFPEGKDVYIYGANLTIELEAAN